MALHALTHPTLDVPGCFGCKAASVAVGFHMCPGGKEEWHGPTIRERQNLELSLAEKRGNKIEPVKQSNYYGPVHAS